jgi:hypothetical protein
MIVLLAVSKIGRLSSLENPAPYSSEALRDLKNQIASLRGQENMTSKKNGLAAKHLLVQVLSGTPYD